MLVLARLLWGSYRGEGLCRDGELFITEAPACSQTCRNAAGVYAAAGLNVLRFWLRVLFVIFWALNAFPKLPGAPSCPFSFLWVLGAWLVSLSLGSACLPPVSAGTGWASRQVGLWALLCPGRQFQPGRTRTWSCSILLRGWGVGDVGVGRGFWSLAVMGAPGKRTSSQVLQPLLMLKLFLLQPGELCSYCWPPASGRESQSPAPLPTL